MKASQFLCSLLLSCATDLFRIEWPVCMECRAGRRGLLLRMQDGLVLSMFVDGFDRVLMGFARWIGLWSSSCDVKSDCGSDSVVMGGLIDCVASVNLDFISVDWFVGSVLDCDVKSDCGSDGAQRQV